MKRLDHSDTTRREFLRDVAAGTAVGTTALLLPQLLTGCASIAMSAPTGFVYDDIYLKHLQGRSHAERPERLTAIVNRMRDNGVLGTLHRIDPFIAELDQIGLVHEPDYIELVRSEIEDQKLSRLSTGDTAVTEESYVVARWAVGGALAGVDAVLSGKVSNCFCAIRPPGHHSGPGRGMGFCIFNNVAIAARYAQEKYGLEKVLIVDWDVHHGNGTQDAFYSDPSVFYFSTHQSPFYPGTGMEDETGEGEGKGTTLNVPMAEGTGDEAMISAFTEKLMPAARRFKPDLVLISAGFDAREGDLIGGFKMTDEGYVRLTEIVREIARESASDRIVSVLEGGYSLEGLASAAEAHIRALRTMWVTGTRT